MVFLKQKKQQKKLKEKKVDILTGRWDVYNVPLQQLTAKYFDIVLLKDKSRSIGKLHCSICGKYVPVIFIGYIFQLLKGVPQHSSEYLMLYLHIFKVLNILQYF